MNKFFLLATTVLISTSAWAQKQNIVNAYNELKDKNHKEALDYINKAIVDPSTKEDPKAWYIKGNIHMDMQNLPAYKAENPYMQAADAYMQAVKLKSNYEKETIDPALIYAAQLYYNDAVSAYNSKNYTDAYNWAKKTIEIKNLEGGKRYTSKKALDTVAANALVIQTYSAYYGQKYEEALPLLNDMKNNAIVRDANVYLLLSDVYSKTGAADKQIAALEEGRATYPENQNLRNEELNYYIRTGQQSILMKKLEEGVAKEPNNAVLLFNLANGYMGMAFPKDATGKELPRPDNFNDMIGKAEAGYLNALKIDGKNAEYNYNTGVLYYNQATEINKQMNSLGNTAADDKKYKELEIQRNVFFDKAAPYFETAYTELDSKLNSLSPEDKFTYKSAVIALKEIYAKQNKLDKSAEMKKKLESIN